MDRFLGEPVQYWQDLQRAIDEGEWGDPDVVKENIILRGKLSRVKEQLTKTRAELDL